MEQDCHDRKQQRGGAGIVPLVAAAAFLSVVGGVGTIFYQFLTTPSTPEELLSQKGYLMTRESLFRATEKGDLTALRQFEKSGQDFNAEDGLARTPLIVALSSGQFESVGFLIERTSDLDAVDSSGMTALMHAVDQVAPNMVLSLLDGGARPAAPDGAGSTLLEQAARTRSVELVEALFENGAKAGLNEALVASISPNGSDEVVKVLLQGGADAASVHESAPLLHHALRAGRLDLAKALLTFGADIDARSEAGYTALHEAITKSRRDRIEFLLARGANPDLSDADGRRPLSWAIESSDRELSALLLKNGANPNLADGDGGLSIFQAVKKGDIELTNLLMQNGAEVGRTDKSGITPLGHSLDMDRGMTTLILDAGANLDAPCQGEHTPLEVAFEANDAELCAFLLDRGAAPHPSLFLDAVESGSMAFAGLLLEHGVDVDFKNSEGDTPLLHCIRRGDHALVDFLLSRGADILRTGAEGQEPLVMAVALQRPLLVQRLIDEGADPNAKLRSPANEAFRDNCGSKKLAWYLSRDSRFTPLMVAAGGGHPETMRVLLKNGARKGDYTRSWKRYPINFAAAEQDVVAQQIMVGADPSDAEEKRHVVIDLSSQRARLYIEGEMVLSSDVSTGMKGYETPPGEYVITNKHRHWVSNIYDAEMPYFMRLSCGAFGMHVGYCPGYPASHGCIRMPQGNCQKLWSKAPVGTHVSIIP